MTITPRKEEKAMKKSRHISDFAERERSPGLLEEQPRVSIYNIDVVLDCIAKRLNSPNFIGILADGTVRREGASGSDIFQAFAAKGHSILIVTVGTELRFQIAGEVL